MSAVAINEKGNRYGKLLVVKKVQKGYKIEWLCRCDCGGSREEYGYNLRKGFILSCGCLRKERKDCIRIDGLTFGKLTVLYQDKNAKDKTRWWCKCVCGNVKSIPSENLRYGKVTSCGCSRKKRNSAHQAKKRYRPPKEPPRIKKGTMSVNSRYFYEDQTEFLLAMQKLKERFRRYPTDSEILEESKRLGYRLVAKND